MDNTTVVKRCSRCGEVKSADQFYPRKDVASGLSSQCRSCDQKRGRNRYHSNLEAERARSRQYREENVDKERRRTRRYKKEHREEIRQKGQQYYRDNKQAISEKAKQFRVDNPGLVKAWQAASAKRCSEQRKLYAQEYRKTNSAATTASVVKWQKRNPEKVRVHRARASALRRLRESATHLPFTAAQFQAKWDYWGGKCWMCGEQATEMDHVKPIAKGGAHMIANMRPACKPCNIKKRDRWPL